MGSLLHAVRRVAVGLAAASLIAGTAAAAPAPATAVIDIAAPVVNTPVLAPSLIHPGEPFAVTATATDGTDVASADVSVAGGAWTAMSATDGAFGGLSEGVTSTIAGVVSISGGAWHTCAVIVGGSVRCWGSNSNGQLGNGTTTDSPTPVAVSGITNAIAVSAGDSHTCAILDGGAVRCWGSNVDGQLGNNLTADSSTPVAVLGIAGVGNLASATAISAGGHHTCAIIAGGTVNCWGSNGNGQLSENVFSTTYSAVPVVVLDGITALEGATAISAGTYHVCAIVTDGVVKCWGGGSSGQLGLDAVPAYHSAPVAIAGITGATAISGSYFHVCVILSGGTVSCWGTNPTGQLGDGTAAHHSAAAVVAFGVTGATSIATGGVHSCARSDTGSVWCWGDNGVGQFGKGTDTGSYTPVLTLGFASGAMITAGNVHTCAALADGVVSGAMVCSGYNANGQLGDGTAADRHAPVPVGGLVGSLAVGTHAVCVRATDTALNVSAGTDCTTVTVAAPGTDILAPVFSVPMTVTLRTGYSLSSASTTSAAPVVLSWSAADAVAGSGLHHYTLQKKVNTGVWTGVAIGPLSTSLATTMPTSGTVAYRVTAYDATGNSAVSVTAPLLPRITQNTSTLVKYKGVWSAYAKATLSGGSDKYSRAKNATATYAFTGRAIALVVMKGPGRGSAKVYVDGLPPVTVSLYRSSAQYRVLVWRYSFASVGAHTVKVVVSGTAGKPRVDVDAFVVVK